MTAKRKYYDACSKQDTAWLAKCAAAPSEFMLPIHVKIIRLVLRKRRQAG